MLTPLSTQKASKAALLGKEWRLGEAEHGIAMVKEKGNGRGDNGSDGGNGISIEAGKQN